MKSATRNRHQPHAFVLTMLLALTWAATAAAHVDLNSPNGGETLVGGSNYSIRWMPAIAMHDTLNYDLWYSTAAATGPWTVIAADVPAGDLSVGSAHAYAWTVPNTAAPSAWVRVRQDNGSQDYEDVSENSFAIVAQLLGDFNNNQKVDAADYVAWRNQAAPNPADYATWRTNFGRAPAAAAFQLAAVPEPSNFRLVLAMASIVFLAMPAREAKRRGRLRQHAPSPNITGVGDASHTR